MTGLLPMLTPNDFFDLNTTLHAAVFDNAQFCWEPLKWLDRYVGEQLAGAFPAGIHPDAKVHPAAVVNPEAVHIGAGAVVMPQAYVEGPAIISAGATVGQGAYVRSHVILSPGAILGHACEAKNALFLEDAHAPHFAYVGDSILGARVNLGAGTKLSNLAMSSEKDPVTGKRPSVIIQINDQLYDTGLAKFGAVIGDDAQTGCNTVTNPGTLIGKRTLIYAMALIRKGYYPPDSIVKVRQTQQVVERRASPLPPSPSG
jgi:NDP-sugar pyrophosphorylase family protein